MAIFFRRDRLRIACRAADDIFICWRRHDWRAPSRMRLTELDYNLPPELIAQEPLERRDEARLMVLDRRGGTIEHSRFYKLGDFLRDGDLLVLNDTRVFPARLFARKPTGGAIELLMVRPVDEPPGAWLALIRGPSRIARGHAADARRRPRAADRGLSAPGPSAGHERRFGADRNYPGERRRAGAPALYSSRAAARRTATITRPSMPRSRARWRRRRPGCTSRASFWPSLPRRACARPS